MLATPIRSAASARSLVIRRTRQEERSDRGSVNGAEITSRTRRGKTKGSDETLAARRAAGRPSRYGARRDQPRSQEHSRKGDCPGSALRRPPGSVEVEVAPAGEAEVTRGSRTIAIN